MSRTTVATWQIRSANWWCGRMRRSAARCCGAARAAGARRCCTRRSNSVASMPVFGWWIRCAAHWPRARGFARSKRRTAISAASSKPRKRRVASTARAMRRWSAVSGDMQSQIARLNQDLSFYRGLVQPESLIHVKVQQMQIMPDSRRRTVPSQVRIDADRQAGQGGRGQRRDHHRRTAAGQAAQLDVSRKSRPTTASPWHTPSSTFRSTTKP